jgi:L-ornithine Nalpha-acyltransferase
MMKKSADLEVRLARTRREVAAAQALRYRVFYKEMGASASLATWILQRDVDQYDRSCDHLLVIDRQRRGLVPWVFGQVVGTCRLMPRSVADRHGGFYSAGEYDLAPVLAWPGECLELGRSCVDPEYRNRAVIDRLWTGIAEYVLSRDIGLLFGCASLPGTRPEELADRLSYLHHFHLAPPELRPRAVAERYVDMQRLPASAIDPRAAWAGLPPLLKGYLRLGAWVGDGAVVDRQFNTTDVCIILQTEQVTRRYFRHYETRVRRPRAA